MAVAEKLLVKVGVRRILIITSICVTCGFALCVPLGGTLYTWQYAIGCCLCSFASVPMSWISAKIFAAGAAKLHGEETETGWLVWLWRVTSTPARFVAPILLGYAMEAQASVECARCLACQVYLSSLSANS